MFPERHAHHNLEKTGNPLYIIFSYFPRPRGGELFLRKNFMNDLFFADFLQKTSFKVGRMKNGNPTFQDMASRPRTVKNVYDKYMELRLVLSGWEYVSEQDIADYLARTAPPEKGKEERIPPTQFLVNWLEQHKTEWVISPMGKRITLQRYGIPSDKDIEELACQIQVDVYNGQLPYKEGEITRCLSSYFMDLYQHGVANMFQTIAHDPKFEKGMEKWLDNLYDYFQPQESREIFHMMMKQWGWQSKRKILGREVKWHIWINLFGASGLGKTTAIKKICSPMEDVTSTTTISKVFDDTREIKRLTENYVLIFDELAINSEREDGDKLTADQNGFLKQLITGDFIDARVFTTQKQAKKKITFSCISSANQHLYDVIYDPDTMRRFFEFHCMAVANGDFSKINKTLENSVYFWKGINEDLDEGYFDPGSELGRQVTAIQKSYYPTKSSVYDWMNECDVKAGNKPAWTAYKYYSQYCRNCGRKAKAMPTFISDIKHAIPESVRNDTAFIEYNVTELCRTHKYDDDELPSSMDDLKPVEPPTCGDFV